VSPSRYVPYSYSPGAIFLFPAGPIGSCRLFTDATMTVCALDPELVAEAGDEPGAPLAAEFRGIKNLRDQSLEGILKLLALEANSGEHRGDFTPTI
jgi:hypothetical protein